MLAGRKSLLLCENNRLYVSSTEKGQTSPGGLYDSQEKLQSRLGTPATWMLWARHHSPAVEAKAA